jgi:hypothetical protein
MDLVATNGNLRGRAETFSDDVLDPTHTREVLATLVDCSSQPVPSIADLRPIPRVVHLESGDSLTLGLEVTPRPNWRALGPVEVTDEYVVEDKAIGLFRPAEDIRVVLNSSGILHSIIISFPDGFDFEDLLSHLTGAVGAPTLQHSDTIDDVQSEMTGWDNRITSLTLSRDRRPTAGWRTYLHLYDPRVAY